MRFTGSISVAQHDRLPLDSFLVWLSRAMFFNRRRIVTTVVCLITSNLARAQAPGNVSLKRGEGNPPKQSIINVSQVLTVTKADLV